MEDIKNWQELEKKVNTPKPLIVLTKSRTFRINSEAMREFGLAKYNFVKVLMNPQTDHIKIGFLFLEEKREGSFSLFAKSKSGAMITAYSLLKKLKIDDLDKLPNRKYKPYKVAVDGMNLIVIDMPIKINGEEKSDTKQTDE